MKQIEFMIDSEDLSPEEKARLCAALSGLVKSDLPLTIELLVVTEEEIRSLNARERGIDRVTDVLSFPAMELERGGEICSQEHGECLESFMTEEGEVETLYLGSVVICKKRAQEQAEEYGHSYARELNYLAVHGVLHCLGYDHESEQDRAQMREREEFVLKKLGLEKNI